jgi:hypothetical protein
MMDQKNPLKSIYRIRQSASWFASWFACCEANQLANQLANPVTMYFQMALPASAVPVTATKNLSALE